MRKAKDAPSAPPAEIIPPTPGAGGKTSKAKAALAKLGLADPKAAERDPEFEGLMAEIESDLREEAIRKLWQRYGKFAIAGLVAVLLGVIGVQVWRDHQEAQRVALAASYDQALKTLQAGKTDDALADLARVAGHSGEGYAAIADLQRSAVLLKQGNIDGAIAIYKALAADPKTDATVRDLATLLQVLHSFDRQSPKDLEVLLAPLLNPSNPFNPSALELSALLAEKEGDTPRAIKLLDQILDDSAMPEDLRARAKDLEAYYKSLLPAPPPAPTKP